MNRKYKIALVITLIIAAFIISQGYYSYSEGERSGYVKEFAKKGYLIKTYEGTLTQQIEGVYNADDFRFSVNDKAIAAQILSSIRNNERINVKYKQKKYLIQPLHGDTEYFITEVSKNNK